MKFTLSTTTTTTTVLAVGLILATAPAVEGRDGCRRNGAVTSCNLKAKVAPGELRTLKEIGGRAGAPAFTLYVEYSLVDTVCPPAGCQSQDMCEAWIEVNDSGPGVPDHGLATIQTLLPGHAHDFQQGGWSLTSAGGEVILVDHNAARFVPDISCQVWVKFQHARDFTRLFR